MGNLCLKVDLRIEIEFQPELLLVTASGDVELESALRLFRQVFDTAAERRVNKVVINTLAVNGELATFERYKLGAELACYLAEHGLNLKLAFVGVPPTMTGFALPVAQNRDVTTKGFPSQQNAMRWLDGLPG